ncbi:MAG: hypothetical protein E7C75_03320 [Anaerococcus sp.]|nr:hypothetical protein [Anaerococcus sp.]
MIIHIKDRNIAFNEIKNLCSLSINFVKEIDNKFNSSEINSATGKEIKIVFIKSNSESFIRIKNKSLDFNPRLNKALKSISLLLLLKIIVSIIKLPITNKETIKIYFILLVTANCSS